MVLSNLSVCCTWKNIKKSYRNTKFEILGKTLDEACELPDGSYFISHIQDYFEYIIKKHETLADKAGSPNICQKKSELSYIQN